MDTIAAPTQWWVRPDGRWVVVGICPPWRAGAESPHHHRFGGVPRTRGLWTCSHRKVVPVGHPPDGRADLLRPATGGSIGGREAGKSVGSQRGCWL